MSGVEWSGVVGGNHTMKWKEGKLDSFLHARFPECHGGRRESEWASFSPSDQMVESIVSRNIYFGNKWESDDVSFRLAVASRRLFSENGEAPN